MSTKEVPMASFLKEVMRQSKHLPSQLPDDLGVSHATVHRWLSGDALPVAEKIPRWQAELWSYISSGDGMHCPFRWWR